jgi:hypothetical protein
MKTLRKKTADAKLMQEQHVARVDLSDLEIAIMITQKTTVHTAR